MISNATVLLACDRDGLAVRPLAVRVTQAQDRLRDLVRRDQPLLARRAEDSGERLRWRLASFCDDPRNRLFRHVRVQKSGADGVAGLLGALELPGDAPRQTNHGVV